MINLAKSRRRLLITVVLASASLLQWPTLGWTQRPERGGERFTLTRGGNSPVCQAYLNHLNNSYFADPAYCGRPESGDNGFTELNRVPLDVAEYNKLRGQVWNFTHPDIKGLMDRDPPRSGVTDSEAWKFSPRLDVENDGHPISILVWSGVGADVFSGACGQIGIYGLPDTVGLRTSHLAYVMTDDDTAIDGKRTREIFGHPSQFYCDRGVCLKSFRPIGRSIGFFKYDGHVYFDTFFDAWGDFENRRQENPRIANTLAVFIRKSHQTKQVCELQRAGGDIDFNYRNRLQP